MPNIDKHPAGAFCWIELATSDQNAAKTYYSGLFGWEANDYPMGPGVSYTVFKLRGRDASACYTLRPDQRSMGVPPNWTLYIAVDNADAAAKKAEQLGGKVHAQPFDVGDFGRMAVVQDPTGAVFCVWQAKQSPGLQIAGEDGAFCWADLSTPDVEAAAKFYSGLFGWKLEKGEKDPSGYLHIKNGEHFIGGVPPSSYRNANTPPHWLSYIQVSNCDTSAAKAKELGGKFLMPPTTMQGVGRWAVISDPQGAVLSVFQPEPRM